MPDIDLNCDLGEGCGNDADIVPLISSANIACGAHAGDDDTIVGTLRLCRRFGVAVGAHPGYPDRSHFGRRELGSTPAEIRISIQQQIAHFLDLARGEQVPVRHLKLHGALYNRAADDASVASVVIDAALAVDRSLWLVGRSGSGLLAMAAERGLRTVHEVFPDRSYDPMGRLLPRSESGAVIEDPMEVATRALQLAIDGSVRAQSGARLTLRADTLCLHGDRPDATEVASAVSARLRAAGLNIIAPA